MFPKLTLNSLSEQRESSLNSTKQPVKFPIVPPKSDSVVTSLPVVNEETPTWFVVLSPRETKGPTGPFSFTQLKQLYKREEISDRTLVWRDGEKEWKQLVQQTYLKAQLTSLPPIPPKVSSYNSELKLFQPFTKIQLSENARFIPLPEKDVGCRACNMCGGVAMLHSKESPNNFEDLHIKIKQEEVGSNEHTTEILPGFLWVGSLSASKPATIASLGITLLINASGYTDLIKSHPPYFRVKDINLREGFEQFNDKQELQILEILERVYDYIELERLNSERNNLSDPIDRYNRKETDQYGQPLKDDKPFRRPDIESGPFFAPRILIYSKNGSNRSCFLAISYLIKRFGMTSDVGMNFVRRLRDVMELDRGFINLLEIWGNKYSLGFLVCLDCSKLIERNNMEDNDLSAIEIGPDGVIHFRKKVKQRLDAPDSPSSSKDNHHGKDIDESIQELGTILHSMHSNPVNKIKEEQKKELTKILSISSFIHKWNMNQFFDSAYGGLIDLNLSNQQLSDATISVLIQLMENLSMLHQIRILDLSNNQVKSIALKSLLLAFYAKVSFDPDHDSYLEDENVYNNPNNNQDRDDDDSSETAFDWTRVPNLISLDLSHNCLDENGVRYLTFYVQQNDMLQSLNVFNNQLSDRLMGELLSAFITPTSQFGKDPADDFDFTESIESSTSNVNQPPKKRRSRSSYSKKPTQKQLVVNGYFETTHYNQSVTNLSIGRNELGPVASEVLVRVMKQNVVLTHLSIDGVMKMTPIFFKNIVEAIRLYNSYLLSLSLEYLPLSVKSCEYVAKLLRKPMNKLQMINIHTLNLQKCSITFLHLKFMRKFLSLSRSLRVLNLSFNTIGDEGAVFLSDILLGREIIDEFPKKKKKKQEEEEEEPAEDDDDEEDEEEVVDENGNRKKKEKKKKENKNEPPPPEMPAPINPANSPPITSLDLSCCQLTEKGCRLIIQALTTQQRLFQKLDLSLNPITSKCFELMTELSALPVTELNLNSTRLQTKGCKYLFQLLTPSIESISPTISSNQSQPISSTLRIHLRQLHLSNNELSDSIGMTLAQCLVENTRLNELDLSFNKLTDANKSLFQQAVAIPSTASIDQKLEDLFIRMEGNPCDALIFDAPGMSRCKTKFNQGIYANRFNSNNNGYDHVDAQSRTTFLARKAIKEIIE